MTAGQIPASDWSALEANRYLTSEKRRMALLQVWQANPGRFSLTGEDFSFASFSIRSRNHSRTNSRRSRSRTL
jgi:hypothetical protein